MENRKPTTMATWLDLPKEIHTQIWEYLAHEGGVDPKTSNRGKSAITKGNLSRYASVSKAWQEFFEKKIYSFLIITPSCLGEFEKLVQRQRHLVEYIWYKVEVPKYVCGLCENTRDRSINLVDNGTNILIVNDAIIELFKVLATWDADQKLTLELGLLCPSDKEHKYLPEFYVDSSPFADVRVQSGPDSGGLPHLADHHLSDRPNRRNGNPRFLACLALIHGPLARKYLDGRRDMPTVQAVKHIVLRRQTRQFVGIGIMKRVLVGTTRLEKLSLEVWRPSKTVNAGMQQWYFRGKSNFAPDFIAVYGFRNLTRCNRIDLISLLGLQKSTSLSTLSIFEDFNQYYSNHESGLLTTGTGMTTIIDPDIIAAETAYTHQLMLSSQKLTNLHVSNNIDATLFFDINERAINGGYPFAWRELSELSVTSHYLHPSMDLGASKTIFVWAAHAAMNMPKLTRMEIWNAVKKTACVFRYQLQDGLPTLEWRASWDFQMHEDVPKLWKKLIEVKTGRELVVKPQETILDEDAITSHAVAIRMLGLSEEVIHPVSLEQIRRENEITFL